MIDDFHFLISLQILYVNNKSVMLIDYNKYIENNALLRKLVLSEFAICPVIVLFSPAYV